MTAGQEFIWAYSWSQQGLKKVSSVAISITQAITAEHPEPQHHNTPPSLTRQHRGNRTLAELGDAKRAHLSPGPMLLSLNFLHAPLPILSLSHRHPSSTHARTRWCFLSHIPSSSQARS